MPKHGDRRWLGSDALAREAELRQATSNASTAALRVRIDDLITDNRRIHEHDCLNLNPATNVMNPRAEAALAGRLGSRPSLGHAGAKYEMGLEAIEALEVLTHDLACQVFGAAHAEFRVSSGAMANLMAFMTAAQPGSTAIVPPPSIGGHVTHHRAGAAGLYGLRIVEAPIDAGRYTVDVDALAILAETERPAVITIGASCNLTHHPVESMREVADSVGATLLFDAAHLCGPIAGGAWPNPLDQGAHLMTMSTYKSLGGPAGGLIVTNDAAIAERLDAIAFPGLTANFDAGRSTALAITLLDWIDHGAAYATAMVDAAATLGDELAGRGIPLFRVADGSATVSHQLIIDASAAGFDGPDGPGQAAARHLREANILACGIGLPDGDGLRLGTPELVRWGMTPSDMGTVADLVARGLGDDPTAVAGDVTAFRSTFAEIHYCT